MFLAKSLLINYLTKIITQIKTTVPITNCFYSTFNGTVVTDNNESYYTSIGQVNREIILEVDPYVNFANYDNLNGNSFGTDGKVDFIYIIYRNATSSHWYYSGLAHLEVSTTISVDGKYIYNNSYINGGVQQRGGYNGRDYTMYVAAHELGHYLLGGGHIDGAGNLCLMSGTPAWNSSRGMHSWERQKLGWISYTDKTTDGSVTMSDYMTADQVYRVPINSSEYFLIENRGKLSSHDKAGDTGFYFYKVTGSNTFPPDMEVLSADGNWDFSFNTSNLTITKTTPNPIFGKNELNKFLYWDSNGDGNAEIYACYTPVYTENAMWGDTEDAFDETFNDVLSPVSNPSSFNSTLNFSVEVTGTNTIQFYFTDPYAGSPSKPQNLALRANPGNNRVRLTWDANTEPDISSYEIYRKVNTSGWGYLATTSNNFYVDTQWQYDQGSTFDVKYKIVAKDNTNKASVFSDEVTCHPWPMGKRAAELVSTDIPVAYSLSNYPNPFNPSTKISYSLPQAGHVTLKVYDVLGREVAELVNGVKEKGKHSVMFNASKNASGFYIYTIRVNDFYASKKMLLTK